MLNFNSENERQENRLFDDTLENNYPEIQKINELIVKGFEPFFKVFNAYDAYDAYKEIFYFIPLVKITTLIEEQLEKNNNYELPLLLKSVLLIKKQLRECVYVKYNTLKEIPDLNRCFSNIFDELDQFMEHIKTIQEKIEKKQGEFKEKIINKRVYLFSSNYKNHSEIENSRYSDFMEDKYGTDNDEVLFGNEHIHQNVKSKLWASTGDLGTNQIMPVIESVTEKRSCFLVGKSKFLPVASDELPHLGPTDSNKKETLKSSDFKKNESSTDDDEVVLFDDQHIPEKAKPELFSPTGDLAWHSGTPTPSPTKQHCQHSRKIKGFETTECRRLNFSSL